MVDAPFKPSNLFISCSKALDSPLPIFTDKSLSFAVGSIANAPILNSDKHTEGSFTMSPFRGAQISYCSFRKYSRCNACDLVRYSKQPALINNLIVLVST